MKFMILIYTDPALLGAMPAPQFDATMRGCLEHADELRSRGTLLDSQMLEDASAARSIRVRGGRRSITDGPFAETKEMIAGFNLIEARDMDAAVQIAEAFPWAATGCVEIRPVREIAAVRERVGM